MPVGNKTPQAKICSIMCTHNVVSYFSSARRARLSQHELEAYQRILGDEMPFLDLVLMVFVRRHPREQASSCERE
ncbi:MAG: hypothetical protein INR71_04065 [Terriglobus roseus]|nr:hypothetical protein [Terriglobus roseus]